MQFHAISRSWCWPKWRKVRIGKCRQECAQPWKCRQNSQYLQNSLPLGPSGINDLLQLQKDNPNLNIDNNLIKELTNLKTKLNDLSQTPE